MRFFFIFLVKVAEKKSNNVLQEDNEFEHIKEVDALMKVETNNNLPEPEYEKVKIRIIQNITFKWK